MTTAAGFQPLSLSELFSLQLPDVEFVVDELLPLGHAFLLSAREKAGKGLLAIDLCASVAMGEPFLDRATLEGPAIYAAAEEQVRDVRARIAARIGDRRDAPLYVLPLDGSTGDRLDLSDATGMQRLYDMVMTTRPALVVLDVLRELHDRTEDSSDEMGPLLRPLRQLAHETNTALVVTHHQRKAGGFRGSTAIKAAFDGEWSLTSDAADNDGPPGGMLRVEGRHGPRQALRVQFGAGGRWELGTVPIADLIAPGRIVLHLETVNDWRTAREIADEIGKPLKTVQNELSRLRAADPCLIATAGNGHKGNPTRYRSVAVRMELDDSQNGSQSTDSLGKTAFGNNPDIVPIIPGNDVGNNGNNRACIHCGVPAADGELYCDRHRSKPAGVDPAVLTTAHAIRELPPADRDRYRAELSAASDIDPNVAHDRRALAIAELMLAGV